MPEHNKSAARSTREFKRTQPDAKAWRLDPAARRGFVATAVRDLATTLEVGVPSPALAARIGATQLQRAEPLSVLLKRQLALPGRPTAADYVHCRLVPRTPLANRMATGRDHALWHNKDIVLAVATPASLDGAGTPYLFVSGSPSSPEARFGLRSEDAPVDEQVLLSGTFAGRGPVFDSGLLVPDRIKPEAITALVCATHAAHEAVEEAVASSGLAIAVALYRGHFIWGAEQARDL